MKRILLLCMSCLSFIMAFAQVTLGIDVLKQRDFDILKGKRVGLLTNATGVDANMQSTIDVLNSADGVKLVCLFAPEHGVRGNVYAGGTVNASVDAKTGLKVHSLYGKTKKPTVEMLKDVDVIVYDIQDVGCRSYTFVSSLGLVMEAAAENGKEVVVLDRPNPLGGNKIEGPLVYDGYFSFISKYPIPYIYGLTVGELATLLNEEKMTKSKCKLTVVPMEGWKRDMDYSQTGLRWVMTSPQIPYWQCAAYYPMSGIVGELGVLNIGVGYTIPFDAFAADWINADSLAMELNNMKLAGKLEGLTFRPIVYKPQFSALSGKIVQGVQVYVDDLQKARLTEVQFYVLEALHNLYPSKDIFGMCTDKTKKSFDNVCGSNKIRLKMSERYRFDDVKDIWRDSESSWRKKSKKYHLYD
ncbi:MAG: DUF1343 domain-containing protein [Bacteroidales bacterium]|nr:DUF1343 domain-containing protein [Candidatus Scybalocola fimicaballi]